MNGIPSNDAISDVAMDLSSSTSNLIIAFAGLRGGYSGSAQFEFVNAISHLPVSKLFMRDSTQSWYQNGIVNVAQNVPDLAFYIRELIGRYGFTKVLTVGASEGGYAALLFGHLLGVDQVLAISPQTFIDQTQRLIYQDFRWSELMSPLHKATASNCIFQNLRLLFEQQTNKTQYHIHYCAQHTLDTLHALHLNGLPGVFLYPHENGGHKLARFLRETGELSTIITNLIKI